MFRHRALTVILHVSKSVVNRGDVAEKPEGIHPQISQMTQIFLRSPMQGIWNFPACLLYLMPLLSLASRVANN